MFSSLIGKKTGLKKQEQVRIVLPEESFGVLDWKKDDLPCVAVVNGSLKHFEHKAIFCWHLSVILNFDELINNGMPSEREREIVDPFCEQLDAEIKAGGNALFLVRETWNATRRLVWRVYDPEIAHQHLNYLVEHHRCPRPFDWHMEQDMTWEKADWYLQQIPDE